MRLIELIERHVLGNAGAHRLSRKQAPQKREMRVIREINEFKDDVVPARVDPEVAVLGTPRG